MASAIERRARSEIAPETFTTVYTRDAYGQALGLGDGGGAVACRPQTPLSDRRAGARVCVGTDADLPEVARTMTDYNLAMLPVVDEEQRMVGVITVDDVLEQTLPAAGATLWTGARLTRASRLDLQVAAGHSETVGATCAVLR